MHASPTAKKKFLSSFYFPDPFNYLFFTEILFPFCHCIRCDRTNSHVGLRKEIASTCLSSRANGAGSLVWRPRSTWWCWWLNIRRLEVSSCMLVGGCRVRFLMRRPYCTLDCRRRLGQIMTRRPLAHSAHCGAVASFLSGFRPQVVIGLYILYVFIYLYIYYYPPPP